MGNFIIGTAGHIDHGKTTLIKSLTGRSTDKLKEEIKRGISINLGFTYFDLPSGKRAGIIDVPGHERFIKNMIAGASGIDLVMIAVDANEGIMPQTIEHLDILSYLNISEAVFVLTKCDIADELMIELVREDLEGLKKEKKGSFLENAEIVEVDSISGRGMEALVSLLDEKSKAIRHKNEKSPARLNIDRVFSMKGFGTVITGTMVEGKITIGDELTVYPGEIKTKVRNIQVHDENAEFASAGQRTAINVSECKVSDLKRGDVLARNGLMKPTSIIDAKISLISQTKIELKTWSRLRVYIGAREIMARLVLLGTEMLSAGHESFCQLRLEEPAAVKKGDRFVIRNYSPMATIGGGIVLDPNPQRHGKSTDELVEALMIKEKGDINELVEDFILSGKESGKATKAVSDYSGQNPAETEEILKRLQDEGRVIALNGLYYHETIAENLRGSVLERLSAFHEKYPLRSGMPKEQLFQAVNPAMKMKEFESFLSLFESEQTLRIINSTHIAISGYRIVYTKHQEQIRDEIEAALLTGGFSPPPLSEIIKSKEYAEVLEERIPETIIRLDGEYCIHRNAYDDALEKLKKFAAQNGKITLAEFRDLLGTTRKYAVLIIESFDKQKITKRVGDERIVN